MITGIRQRIKPMFQKPRTSTYVSLILFLVLLGTVLALWNAARNKAFDSAALEFVYRSNDALSALQQRLGDYEQLLAVSAGIYDISDKVTRQDWQQFSQRLQLAETFSGILGLGFAKRASADDLELLVQQYHAEGYADFRIWPEGERPDYGVIVYLEPENQRNRRFLGYDMFSQPILQEAMIRARDTGLTKATRFLTVTPKEAAELQPDILMYHPLYGQADLPPTVEERRLALRGYVFGAFRIEDLLAVSLGQPARLTYRLEIIDDAQQVIYDSQGDNAESVRPQPLFSAMRPLNVGGQRWMLRFSSLSNDDAATALQVPRWLLLVGVVFGTLLSIFVWSLWTGQQRAHTLSRSLREETNRRIQLSAELRQFFTMSPNILCTLNLDGTFREINPACEQCLGRTAEDLCGQDFGTYLHPDDVCNAALAIQQVVSQPDKEVVFQARNVTADDDNRWIDWTLVAAVHDPWIYGYGRDVTDRKLVEEQLHYNAFHDSLTGIANRSLFLEHLENAISRYQRHENGYAVMIMDIDDFKGVNDNHGHLVGDQLLQAFVQRVQEQLRPSDTFARFGGDEFTLLMEEVVGRDDAAALAERILDTLSSPIVVENKKFLVNTSIGIALGIRQGMDPDNLLRQADLALYRAKNQGKGCFVIFDESAQ